MPDVRYVCLSDLHFGARGSLLTNVTASGEVDVDAASPALVALVDALRTLVAANESSMPPTLVLAGDVLDLAFMSVSTAAMVFDRFVELAFAPGRRCFAPVVHYVPGNHDHHLWEQLRDRRHALRLGASPIGGRPRPEPHTTPLAGFVEDATAEHLLGALIRRHPGCEDVRVVTAYPNLGVRAENRARVAMFSHGHFVEDIYRLVSVVKRMVFPDHPQSCDIEAWEAENHAWIDFFWSTLGQSGTSDLTRMYEMLARPDATEHLIDRLADAIGDHVHEHGGVLGRGAPLFAKAMLWYAARESRARERQLTNVSLSDAGRAGLGEYVDGPVAHQLLSELHGVPDELVVVFGHTHKPFEELLASRAAHQPVEVLNTGGWVVDSIDDDCVQGAAVVLLDDRLEAVSIRGYEQGVETLVRVRSAGDPGPFAGRIDELVAAHHGAWDRLDEAAATLVDERHDLLDRSIAASMATPPAGSGDGGAG